MTRFIAIFDSASPLVFDGTRAQCFVVVLHNTVMQARLKNIIPGLLYTFVLQQDSIGNHRFVWPQTCKQAMPVDPKPDAVTVQNFVGNSDGSLYANAAGTWSEP